MTAEHPRHERDIAIVGAAVRVPEAATPEAFFDRLLTKEVVSRPMPENRALMLERGGLPPPSRTRLGGFLDDIESFDPEFFGISENDARYLDPQQRLFLDVAWEAIERAGYRPDRLPDKRVGVFVGMASNDYTQWSGRAGMSADVARIPGGLNSFAASRVAYCLDLNGPAVAIDAACASSLYAVHLAVQSLRSGETRFCLAGGVNILLLAETTELFDAAGLLSYDGRCRAYDDAASGYFRSEGAVALLLKPMADAVRDGDDILAVIKGTAATQDGHWRAGLVAPSVIGQKRAVLAALEDAGVGASTIDLIEAHGTATRLGDNLEVKALAQAYVGRPGSCALGSAKTRFGHLEAAAGVAGLLSAVFALKRRVVPPTGEVDAPDRTSDLEVTPFFLADRCRTLPAIDRPRRAAVHCYGMGGLNVHVILEEAPPASPATTIAVNRPELFQLSARTIDSLRADIEAMLPLLARTRSGSLADWCRAAAATRKPRGVRVAIIARSLDQLADRLHLFLLAPDRSSLRASFVFASTAGDDRTLIEDAATLPAPVQAAVRGSTVGRWAERHLHAHLSEAALSGPLGDEERTELLRILARAFVAGAELDPSALFSGGARVPFPPAYRANRRLWPDIVGPHVDRKPADEAPALRRSPPDAPPPPEDLTRGASLPDAKRHRVAPETDLSNDLEAVVWECLDRASMRPIGPRDPNAAFFDLGLDSLALARLASLLEGGLGAVLPAQAIFEHPTTATLVAWLSAEQVDPARLKARIDAPDDLPGFARHESFPLTPLQEAYYAAAETKDALGGRSCQVFADLEIDGSLDEARLRDAFERVVERHPMLSVVFTPEGTQGYSRDRVRPALRIEALTGLDAHVADERLCSLKNALLATGADLRRGPMVRAIAADLGDRFRILFTVDLIVADLESVRIFVDEWRTLYDSPDHGLRPLALTFDEYQRLVAERTPAARRARDRAHWMGRIDQIAGPPALALLRDPQSLSAAHFGSKNATLHSSVWERLQARARFESVTPSALLGGAFAETLARAGDGKPFCLNLPAFDRRPFHRDVEAMVGPFSTNVLVSLSGQSTDTVARAREFESAVRVALEHRTFSGVELARAITSRRRSAAPIAPVVFTAPLYGRRFEPWGRAVALQSQTPHAWLDCQVLETGSGLLMRWDYVEELFHPETIAALFRDFVGLVRTLAEGPNPVLDGPHVRVRHTLASNAAVSATTLDGIVADQAARAPSQRAVIAGDAALTYGDLNQAANRVANSLRHAGVNRGALVVIACDRSLDQVAMVVGALRAGAVYVPVDCSQPDARVAQIVASARPDAILADARNRSRAFARGATCIGTADALAARDDFGEPASTGDNLAYVIFTSGSSGEPKGVMIQHGAAINTIVDINQRFDLCPLDRVLGFSSLGFDLSVWDCFGAFAAGAALAILPDAHVKTPSAWLQLIEDAGITVWNSVPTGMNMLVEFFEGRVRPAAHTLRLVMLSGDWIPVGLPDRVRALFEGVEVVSLGGATEASIWSCVYPIGVVDPRWTSIPYGRALSNQRFHILDEQMAPVADGDVGELYIGGRGVALGYLGDAVRTRERFVEGPPGLGRLYRTGDLGRWTGAGEMEFLGRKDQQVKIRGNRVEIAEIETALRTHPGLSDCAVSVRGDRNERELVAHYVERTSLEARDLLEHLRSRLPDYMVPQHFVKHTAIPLNVNGKIDRLQLS